MKLILGSDKAGFGLKKELQEYLSDRFELIEVGSEHADHAVPFIDVASDAARRLQNGEGKLGILICGTGMGMTQVAGKFKGIRAACTESVYTAKMARVINDSNVLCMGGWVVGPMMAKAMADVFLETEFVSGIEEWRKEWLLNAKKNFLALEDTLY